MVEYCMFNWHFLPKQVHTVEIKKVKKIWISNRFNAVKNKYDI
jgi:hypothetical protein